MLSLRALSPARDLMALPNSLLDGGTFSSYMIGRVLVLSTAAVQFSFE